MPRAVVFLLGIILLCAPAPSDATGTATSDVSRNALAASSWLRTYASRPNGAFMLTPSVINPRYANTAALGLLLQPATISRVQNWMTWYLGHLNWPDQWGTYGTIYDHYISGDGKPKCAGASMSVASNGATFLSVAWAMWQHGDRNAHKFLLEVGGGSKGHIFDVIASAVVEVVNSSHRWDPYETSALSLTAACDVWRGLEDIASLLDDPEFNLTARATYYRLKADELRSRVDDEMWSEKDGLYRPHIGAKSINLEKWHPDAVVQVYPIVYGLLSPSSARAAALWSTLKAAWPGLGTYSYSTQDPSPWEIVTFAAVLMGDVALAKARLAHSEAEFVSRNFPFPWTCEEAGWYLHTNTYLALRSSSLPFA